MKRFIFFFAILASKSLVGQTIVQGYTDKQSYRAGENIKFFTLSDVSSGQIAPPLVKKGISSTYYSGLVFPANLQSSQNTNNPYINGFGYSQTLSWTVPSLSSLSSGMYYIPCSVAHIPFVVKADTNNMPDIIIVWHSNTDNAYCSAGYGSLYGGPSVALSQTVSFNRPLLLGQGNYWCDLGFLKWLNTANINASIGFICDKDLEDYREFRKCKLLIVPGHSEYWSRAARENFDKFIDKGGNALILSGNTMWWQVRYQTDPNPSYPGNPQLVCNKTTPGHYDGVCDSLLVTKRWFYKSLKFSTLASMGADWSIGGFSDPHDATCVSVQGFLSHKVIMANSPLFENMGLQNGDLFLAYKSQNAPDAEIDGVLAHPINTPSNMDPILEVEEQDFYKAELIAYDRVTYCTDQPIYPSPHKQPPFYTGIIALQKTCSSGKIINVCNSQWCASETFTNSAAVPAITSNMITKLISNSNIFASTSAPIELAIFPGSSRMVYETCMTNGDIKLSPCGVTINDGYKIDRYSDTDGDFYAKVIDCASCMRSAHRDSDQNTDNLNGANNNYPHSTKLFPNPGKGIYTFQSVTKENYTISIYDVFGKQVKNVSFSGTEQQINIENLSNGVYTFIIKPSNGPAQSIKVIKE
jgi:hypothetical protein